MEAKIDREGGTSGRFERNLINIELFTSLASSVCSAKFFLGAVWKSGEFSKGRRDFLGYVVRLTVEKSKL